MTAKTLLQDISLGPIIQHNKIGYWDALPLKTSLLIRRKYLLPQLPFLRLQELWLASLCAAWVPLSQFRSIKPSRVNPSPPSFVHPCRQPAPVGQSHKPRLSPSNRDEVNYHFMSCWSIVHGYKQRCQSYHLALPDSLYPAASVIYNPNLQVKESPWKLQIPHTEAV